MGLQANIITGGMGVGTIVPTQATQNFVLRAQRSADITRLRVVQLTGSKDGFTARFYSKMSAADPADASAALSADSELYRVATSYVAASGSDGGAEEMIGKAIPYVNMDGTPSNRKPAIYMHLTVAGGVANKTFGASICFSNTPGF